MEKEAELYHDNKVTQSTMGIFKDGACEVVKDIGVDEVAFHDKIIVEDEDTIGKSAITNGHSISARGKDASEQLLSDNSEKCGGRFDSSGHMENEVSSGKIEAEKSIPKGAFGGTPTQPVLSLFDSSDDLKRCLGQKSDYKNNLDDVGFPPVATIFVPDACNQDNKKETKCPSYGEAEIHVIASDSPSDVVMPSGKPRVKEQPCHGDGIEDASDGMTALPRSSFDRHSPRDSASSRPTLRELVASTGPVTFSGNVSHRSDSSTTSVVSFAFPVLQSERISSPVRMAKADRRHLRKRRCWKFGMFCCKS